MMGYAARTRLAVVAMTIFCSASSLAAPQSPEPDHSQTPLPKDTKANEAPRKDEITYVPPDRILLANSLLQLIKRGPIPISCGIMRHRRVISHKPDASRVCRLGV